MGLATGNTKYLSGTRNLWRCWSKSLAALWNHLNSLPPPTPGRNGRLFGHRQVPNGLAIRREGGH